MIAPACVRSSCFTSSAPLNVMICQKSCPHSSPPCCKQLSTSQHRHLTPSVPAPRGSGLTDLCWPESWSLGSSICPCSLGPQISPKNPEETRAVNHTVPRAGARPCPHTCPLSSITGAVRECTRMSWSSFIFSTANTGCPGPHGTTSTASCSIPQFLIPLFLSAAPRSPSRP